MNCKTKARGLLSAVYVTQVQPSFHVRENFRKTLEKATIKKTCLGLHGTSLAAIVSICENGFDPKRRKVVFGFDGDYFTNDLKVAMTYSRKREDRGTFIHSADHGGTGTSTIKWHNVLVVEQIFENCLVRDQSTSKEGTEFYIDFTAYVLTIMLSF